MSKQVAILMSAYNKDSQKAKAAQSQSTGITEEKELLNDENKTSRKFVCKNKNKKDVQCYRCKGYGHIAKYCAMPLNYKRGEGTNKALPQQETRNLNQSKQNSARGNPGTNQ